MFYNEGAVAPRPFFALAKQVDVLRFVRNRNMDTNDTLGSQLSLF